MVDDIPGWRRILKTSKVIAVVGLSATGSARAIRGEIHARARVHCRISGSDL